MYCNNIVTPEQPQQQKSENSSKPITEPKILVFEYPDGYREYYSDVRVHVHVQKVLDAPGIDEAEAAVTGLARELAAGVRRRRIDGGPVT